MTTPQPLKGYLSKFYLMHNTSRPYVQVQDNHWNRIGPIHQRTPPRWHKDNIQEMLGRPILFWHNQRGLCQIPNHRLHLPQHSREQQVTISQTRKQRIRRSNNNSSIYSMAVYTDLKIFRPKESNQGLFNNHRKISRVEAIYGPQIPTIQGKAIRWKPENHTTTPRISLPPLLDKHHHNV